SNGHS
ncbi:tRNA sulfurtransferase ThiI, partial [Vibrio parahaemolyticus V-223/04]